MLRSSQLLAVFDSAQAQVWMLMLDVQHCIRGQGNVKPHVYTSLSGHD